MLVSWLCKICVFERNLVVPGETGKFVHAKLFGGRTMIMLDDGEVDSSIGSLSRSATQLDEFNTSSIYMFI